jgi:DNA-binding transcriptional LysR family regulator
MTRSSRPVSADFSPKLGQGAPQISSAVYMVAAGFGMAMVRHGLEQIHAEGIRYLPIEGDGPRASIGLAYRRDNRSQAVRNFVELARRADRSVGKMDDPLGWRVEGGKTKIV